MLFKAFISPTTETYTHTFYLNSFVTALSFLIFPRFLPSSKYLTSRRASKYWRNNQGFTFTKYIFEKGNVVFIKNTLETFTFPQVSMLTTFIVRITILEWFMLLYIVFEAQRLVLEKFLQPLSYPPTWVWPLILQMPM